MPVAQCFLRNLIDGSLRYPIHLSQYHASHPVADWWHSTLHSWKLFLSHGWRKIWFLVFRWAVEWPSGNDGFRHWPWYRATNWSGHLASNWSWLKICKNPTFGHQKRVLAITDSFSLDLSLQLLGWGPTRLVTTFGHQYRPWTTFFRHLFWGLLTGTLNVTFPKW